MIERCIFYETMRKTGSPNLPYVEEISGFSKSKAPVNLFEVLRRLDAFDIYHLMVAVEDRDMASFVRSMWLVPTKTHIAVVDGMDCWLPPEVRRDALIKLYNKTRDTAAVDAVIASVDVGQYFLNQVCISKQ